jgi:ABC-type phosphate transport system substrate-binding protein
MKHLGFFLILFSLFLAANSAYGQNQNRKDYALIFAVQEYDHLPRLDNPIKDAKLLGEVLKNDYGFEEPEIILDPTTTIFQNKMKDYSQKTFDSLDQLLILFIGHGKEDIGGRIAFKNAVPNDNFLGYIDNNSLSKLINGINCKHILFLNHACFSGSAIPGKLGSPAPINGNYIKRYLLGNKSRLCISSSDTTTLDDGWFIKHVIEILKENANQSPLLSEDLLFKLKDKCKNQPTISPRRGTLEGHNPVKDENEFLFVPKRYKDEPESKVNYDLIFSGSGTIGDTLIPELLNAFYMQKGYKRILKPNNLKEYEREFLFNKNTDTLKVLVKTHGTEDAFRREYSDIIMASRRGTAIEAVMVRDETPIGVDAIVIIMNPNNNTIRELSIQEIRTIFTGDEKRWTNFNGKDSNIKLHVLNQNSGTRRQFEKEVLLGKTISSSNLTKEHIEYKDILDAVKNDIDAIGFVSNTAYNIADIHEARCVPLIIKKGGLNYRPAKDNITRRLYPITRSLYLYKYANTHKAALVNSFLNFMGSLEARKIVDDNRFIPALSAIDSSKLTLKNPNKILYERFTNSIKFAPNSNGISIDAEKDISEIVNKLNFEGYKSTKIYIIGYSTNKGSPKQEAQKRADEVRVQLISWGLDEKSIIRYDNFSNIDVKESSWNPLMAQDCVEIWIEREK